VESFSDDALIARLNELAAQRTLGNKPVDGDELARIDAVVYRRLEQTYSKDPHEPGNPLRLDS
jgi:hypothetical protein